MNYSEKNLDITESTDKNALDKLARNRADNKRNRLLKQKT